MRGQQQSQQSKKLKKRSKKIKLDVYNAGDQEDAAEKLLRRRGGGGSTRNYDEIEQELVEYTTENISRENDEEITEDDAFDEEDEEKYGLFFTKSQAEKKSKKSVNVAKELTLSENSSASEDNEEELEEDGEYVDLSQLLDQGDGEPTAEAKPKKIDEKLTFLIPENQSSSEEGEGEMSLSDEDDLEESGSDGDNNLDLTSIIDSMQSKSNKKRKRLEERTETFEESEFMPAVSTVSQKKVGLNDLVGAIQQETNFGELKRQLVSLDKVQTVAAPLAPRIQEKFDRVAAKEETDKSVSKWIPIVKKNREAESLTFPMNEPAVVNLSSGALIGKFEPFTEMEKEINEVLEVSGLSEKRQKEIEELELNKLSKEEMMEKQAELAKMRSLLFFKEQKQKKIAKIKSKTYRKIAKKAAEKNEKVTMEDMNALDPERAKEERERLEFERAKERMTLKHKNTGKWAKRMMGRFESTGSETQKAVMEQLEKGEELRKRIAGYNSSDSDFNSEHEDAFEELNALEREIDEPIENASKGVFGMKFMQKEFQNQKNQVHATLNEARQEFLTESQSDQEEIALSGKQHTGRHQFSKSTDPVVDSAMADNDDGGFDDNASSGFHVRSLANLPVKPKSVFSVESFGVVESIVEAPAAKKSSPTITEKEAKTKPAELKSHSRSTTNTEPDVSIDMVEESGTAWFDDSNVGPKKSINHTNKIFEKESKSAKALAKISSTKKLLVDSGEGSDEEELLQYRSEAEEPLSEANDQSLIHSSHIRDLKNSDIMQMAFSGDSISKDFAKEKRGIANEESGKVVEEGLPGWGDWSGPGIAVSGSGKKRKVYTKPGGLDASKRRDAKLKHVIINEKRVKKAVKYLQPKLPHGFDNREQYERTISNPLGKEWNTEGTHKRVVMPKVITKMGSYIAPLKMSK